MAIEIDGREVLSDYILYTAKNLWYIQSDMSIEKNNFVALIATNKPIRHRIIDHCDVTT